MSKIIRSFVILYLLIMQISCVSNSRPWSRIITLNNETISEEDVDEFTSWYCYDSVHEEKGILLEFGYFNNPNYTNLGFILYDAGCTGELTCYHREGVDHRWNWGQVLHATPALDSQSYSLVREIY